MNSCSETAHLQNVIKYEVPQPVSTESGTVHAAWLGGRSTLTLDPSLPWLVKTSLTRWHAVSIAQRNWALLQASFRSRSVARCRRSARAALLRSRKATVPRSRKIAPPPWAPRRKRPQRRSTNRRSRKPKTVPRATRAARRPARGTRPKVPAASITGSTALGRAATNNGACAAA